MTISNIHLEAMVINWLMSWGFFFYNPASSFTACFHAWVVNIDLKTDLRNYEVTTLQGPEQKNTHLCF